MSLQVAPPGVRVLAASSWPAVVERSDAGGGFVLQVDQSHPFFFDHELDHAPAMLLLAAQLDVLRAESGLPLEEFAGRRLRADIRFDRMSDLDGEPILLDCAAGASTDWRVTGDQHGARLVDGLFSLATDGGRRSWASQTTPETPTTPALVASEPIEQRLVHRTDRVNVVLGAPTVGDGWMRAAVLPPAAGHYLRSRSSGAWGVEELVESGRQFVTAAWHLVHGRPSDTQLLLQHLTFDLPLGLPSETPVLLHWKTTPMQGARCTFDVTVASGVSGAVLGRVALEVRGVSPAGYRRLREQTLAGGRQA